MTSASVLRHDSDDFVESVLAQYAACSFRPSNANQFTIIAGFILHLKDADSAQPTVKVVSLASGAKCLPTASFSPGGDALHDSHAEVLARRALIRWLSEELQRAVHADSPWLRRHEKHARWALREDAKVYMYVSAVPCGDASTGLLASTQDPALAALKDSAPPIPPAIGVAARGRDGYALRGVLRTKPGRADAPPTICMSCSDKIAAWNVLGLQGALLSRVLDPIYISTVILGGVPHELRQTVKNDCERAFFVRLEGIKGLPEDFRLSRPSIHFTDLEFSHSREALVKAFPRIPSPTSSNDSLCWVADSPAGKEVVINGLRRGTSTKLRALGKCRPILCKLQIFKLHNETMRALGLIEHPPNFYHHAKLYWSLEYRMASTALKGPGGPFAGWIISGRPYESFDLNGTVIDESKASPTRTKVLEEQDIQNRM